MNRTYASESKRRFARAACAVPVACSALAATVAASSSATSPRPGPSRAPASATEPCPLRTARDWQSFLDDVSADPTWVETCEDSACDSTFNQYVESHVADTLDRCAATIAREPQIAACTEHLRSFLPAFVDQHTDHTYGFTAPNRAYFALEDDASKKPAGMMEPPALLARALPGIADALRALEEAGIRYVIHDSCLGGVRIYIHREDPMGRFDQWMLLNMDRRHLGTDTRHQNNLAIVPADIGTDPTMPMSFMAVQKKDVDGRALAKVRVYFRDYYLADAPDGSLTFETHADSNGKCFACHASGTRKIMVVDRQPYALSALAVRGEDGFGTLVSDVGAARLAAFNERLLSYGLPDWEGMIEPARHGPALGEAQGCTECHDGHERAELTVSTSANTIRQRVLLELAMPPDDGLPELLLKGETRRRQLTQAEADRLDAAEARNEATLQSYLAARSPSLRAWLLEKACDPGGKP